MTDKVAKSKVFINLCAVIACFLWSTAFVGIKIGLKYMQPFSFAGIRFMLSGLILIPFCGNFISYLRIVKTNLKSILILSLFQTFILYGVFFVAMTFVPGALAAIIIGSSPLTAAITTHFALHDDKMNIKKFLSVIVGIIGVVIISISRKPWILSGLKEVFGILLLIVTSISSAYGNVLVSKNKTKINPIILNSSQIFLGGFFLFLLSLFVEGEAKLSFSLEFYLALFWLAILSAVAFSIWFKLLQIKNVKVSSLNIWKFIIPVFGGILSWIILPNESPDFFMLLGMLAVSTSIIIYFKFND